MGQKILFIFFSKVEKNFGGALSHFWSHAFKVIILLMLKIEKWPT